MEYTLGKSDYNDAYFYDIDVKDSEIEVELKEVFKQLEALETKKKELAKALLVRAEAPSGWSKSIKKISEHGYITARIFRIVYREKKEAAAPAPLPPIPPKTETPLEKITKHIDPKTLFNSGILTKEEKRELLGINDIFPTEKEPTP